MQRHLPRGRTRITTTALTLALVATILASLAPAPLVARASAAAWTVNPSGRTEAQMRARWEQLKPTYTGPAYAVAPNLVAPYAPGATTPGFQADGINMINYGRYLAGLPSDVTLTATRNVDGQHGAVLLKVIGFSHTPTPRPPAMDQAFYDRGYAATSRSNIGSGYSDIESFTKACLDDADATNIQKLGHRRWLLNPRMLYTGVGFADNRVTTYAIDSSRPAADVNYSYVAWPSSGVFPVEFASSRTPWSITLNPAQYSWDTAVGFAVSMRRLSDGRTWTLNAADTNPSGEYFTANFNGYGINNAFIFRPDPATISYKAGDQFDITLAGGIYAAGTKNPVTVTYRTSFGTLSGTATAFAESTAVTPAPAPVPAPAPAPAPVVTDPKKMPVHRFYNKANGSHFYTGSDAERDAVIAKWSATYTYEGVAYTINTTNAANSSPLYRFYNKANGSHFYTPSAAERDAVIARWSGTYTYEGPVYSVSLNPTGSPMYRFYNKANGSHFYTVSPQEADKVIATMGYVYTFEGVTYYIAN